MMLSQKKPVRGDWHTIDITAALAKRGWSYNQLGFAHGYSGRSSLTNALRRRWPKAELIIANAIGVKPGQIWPSRYEIDLVTPNSTPGRRPLRPDFVSHASHEEDTPSDATRNAQNSARG